MNDETFGIIVAGRIRERGRGAWSTPTDPVGGSTVHFCQKDNLLFILSARSKQELENVFIAKIRAGPLYYLHIYHCSFWLSVSSDCSYVRYTFSYLVHNSDVSNLIYPFYPELSL